jgi:hypothetical protein
VLKKPCFTNKIFQTYAGIKNRRGTISLNRVKRLENFSNRPTFNFGRDEDNAVQPHEVNATRSWFPYGHICVL